MPASYLLRATLLVGVGMLLSFAISSSESKEPDVVVEPKETDELFANPGMGWQTFHTTAKADPNLAGLPSGSAYFRFYWREIEPAEGRIDFPKLDSILSEAKESGQRLSLRIMCTGGSAIDVPEWLRSSGCRGYTYVSEGQESWVPDFEDPRFQKAHFRMIRELGKRYDGRLDVLDIGSVGLWGEWHMSGAIDRATGKEVPLPSLETRKRIVDAWIAAFPKTPKVMLIGGGEVLRYAISKGCGWRADCLGDMGGFSKNWNHMENMYPQAVKEAGAEDAWKNAPVAFESCWDMRKWSEEGWDIAGILDYALRYRVSLMNNKSAPLPEGSRKEVERFLRRIGYRLVVRQVRHAASIRRGGRFEVGNRIENVGVAPSYGRYLLAVRLKGPGEQVYVSGANIGDWKPGVRDQRLQFDIRRDLPPGSYRLSVAFVDPEVKLPVIRFANAGRDNLGWYEVSNVTVR